MNMEADKDLAKKQSHLPEALLDTQQAQADGTLIDIEQMAREAVMGAVSVEIDSSACRLIEKLADLNTIRRLAALSDKQPTTVGPYELLEEIGRGGMGSVYRARHRQLGKIQAIKVIHSNSGMTPEVRARFRREVQAIGALHHKHIIAAHDADFEGDIPYLVMDYIAGESLAEIQKRLRSQGKTFSIGAACEVVRQAAEGIQYAHEQNITHRDIKPGNLMLDPDGTIRVLDLGLARLDSQQSESEADQTELTRGNQILGTPDYMSPEQIQSSKAVDARTDVYALGATLFTLIAGKPVYASQPDESFIAKASRILSEPVPAIRKLEPTVPKELAAIIQKCLAKSPEDRLQSAGALAEAIRPWCDGPSVQELFHTGHAEPERSAAATPQSQSSRPKAQPTFPISKVLIGLALAGITAGLLIAGVIITLKLPGGGELVIDSDDPKAQIKIVAVKDGKREDLSLTREEDNSLRLSEGRWTITIEGVQANQFELSEDQVVINGSAPTRIRVTRREMPLLNPSGDLADSSATPEIMPSENNSISPLAPSEHVFDWSTLRSSNRVQGFVAANAPKSNLANWQIRPWLPELTHHAHYLTANRVAIDPTGKYYAVISQYDCKIMELATGDVLHTIPSLANSNWGGVTLTAGCERIALLSEYGEFIEIRDGRNRLVSQWTTKDLIETARNRGAITWTGSGQQLLVWDDRHASVVDEQGVVQSSIEFDAQAGPEQVSFDPRSVLQRVVECHPDNRRIAFGCVDGRVRVWNLDSKDLQVLPSERSEEVIRALHWSPDGNSIACICSSQTTFAVAMEIWTSSGEIVSTLDEAQMNLPTQYASEFAWSPDCRSFVFGSGMMTDGDGKPQRQFDLLEKADNGNASGISTVWIPCWTSPDRIDFVATGDTYSLQCGRVRSFTPTGRALSSSQWRNILQPQEFSWIEETGELGVVFCQTQWSELRTWTEAGTSKSSIRIPSFVSGKIQAKNGNLLCIGAQQAQIIDRDGKAVGNHQFGDNEDFALGQACWNHAGDRTAYVGKVGNEEVARLLDNAGETVASLKFSSGEYNSSTGYFFWSPDDRYLAMVVLMDDSRQRVMIWELGGIEFTPVKTITMDDSQAPCIAWSPGSDWLIVAPGQSDSEKGVPLHFVHAPTRQTKKISTKHPYYGAWHAPEWFNAKTVRLAGIALSMPNEPSGEISVHDLGFTLDQAVAAVNMSQPGAVLLAVRDQVGQSRFEVWKDEKLQSSTPSPTISSSRVAKSPDGTKAVFFAGRAQAAFVQVDLASGAWDYIGAAFDNGESLEVFADDDTAAVTTDANAYLGYILCHAGGAEVTMTRTQFEQRQQADASTSALQWVLDVGGAVQIEGTDGWFSRRDGADSLAALIPAEVVGIDLSRCMIAEESLSRLEHFPELRRLDLSNIPLQSLEGLPELRQLTELSLRHLSMKSLNSLQHIGQLQRLDLSHTPVDSSVAIVLFAATGLQYLNLSGTQVDRFILQDLSELPSLTEVDIRQTQISPNDAAKFLDARPTIRMLSTP